MILQSSLLHYLELRGTELAYLQVMDSRMAGNKDCDQHWSSDSERRACQNSHGVVLLLNGGYSPTSAHEVFRGQNSNGTVAVAAGCYFLSNPVLPFCVNHGLELNSYQRDSVYAAMLKKGYIDYPFVADFDEGDQNENLKEEQSFHKMA